MRRLFGWLQVLVLALTLSAAVVPASAFARPGGGSSFRGSSTPSTPSRSGGGSSYHSSSPSNNSSPSYSSGSGSSSTTYYGGGSGGGGSMAGGFFVIFLFIAIVIVVVWLIFRQKAGGMKDWGSSVPDDNWRPAPAPDPRPKKIQEALAELRSQDTEFSQVVFEDFLYALYAEVQRRRGQNGLSLVKPYVADAAMQTLGQNVADAVTGIIVGAMRIDDVQVDRNAGRVVIRVDFQANYTEKRGPIAGSGGEQSYYVDDVWTLSRDKNARSRAPGKAQVIGCPNCGAPLERLVNDKCRYCNQTTVNSNFDWRVDAIQTVAKETRGPILTGDTEEEGTNLPTLVANDANAMLNALMTRDTAFTWSGFTRRVGLIFETFHQSWSAQDLTQVRPYLSDSLFEMQRYWVETYKAAHLRNMTDQRHIVGMQMSKLVRDAHYDAIVVRVFAECLDFTLDQSGKVVGGSRNKLRQFTEYWTLIRASTRTGVARVEPGCPNCGAPTTAINMAGKCGSCGAKVTLGEFDWVLSKIEQDEVFAL